MIADCTDSYIQMIQEYQSEADEAKKAQKLKELTFLSEFNESELNNDVSKQLDKKIDKKDLFKREYARKNDVLNNAAEFVEVPIKGSCNPEDALIELIDSKKLKKKRI
jgi:hypothetical protein